MSMVDRYAPDLAACRQRQRRLIAAMQRQGWSRVLLTRGESIQWLTGAYLGPLSAPCAAIETDGSVTLVIPERKLGLAAAADRIVGYAAKRHSTMRDDQANAAAEVLVAALPPAVGAAAGEWSAWRPTLQGAAQGQISDAEPTLFALRRRKDADELRMMARANEANAAMYARAREIVAPGLSELDLYCELYHVAVLTLGEPPTYFGQDFQAAARGGPPRPRVAEAGDLWILDLGVGFRGYYSDNARTLAVSEPTSDQRNAWGAVREIFDWFEQTARPGMSCREIFFEAQRRVNTRAP